jgi:DNA-binding MarR family transcriptional regulator
MMLEPNDEVTLSQIHATRHLDVAGTRLTDMALRAAMTKQSMSELVCQLERRGMVTRRPDPTALILFGQAT